MMSAGSKENCTSGNASASFPRSVSLNGSMLDAAFPLQGHPHHGVLRPPHPLIHGVDRVSWRGSCRGIPGHLHVVRSRGLFDDLQGLQNDLLGPVDVRSVRGADAKPELPGVDGRENLRAQPRAQPPDDRQRHDEIRGHKAPAEADDPRQQPLVAAAESLKGKCPKPTNEQETTASRGAGRGRSGVRIVEMDVTQAAKRRARERTCSTDR